MNDSNRKESQPARQYNAFAVRRCVRRQEAAPGVVIFAAKSFTDAGDNSDKYHPVIDLESREVRCDCAHFQYRLAWRRPTVASDPAHWCKHLLRAVHNCRRAGELAGVLQPPGEVQ
jgi:hypothetical protein